MNKSEFARTISHRTGVTQKEAMSWLNLIIDIMAEQLVQQNEVKLRGFGTFRTVKRPEKMMTNPQTKERITIPERHVPTFVPGRVLRESVRDGVQ